MEKGFLGLDYRYQRTVELLQIHMNQIILTEHSTDAAAQGAFHNACLIPSFDDIYFSAVFMLPK